MNSSDSSSRSSPYSWWVRFRYHLLRRHQLYLIVILFLVNFFSIYRIHTLSTQLEKTKQLLRQTLLSWNQGFSTATNTFTVSSTVDTETIGTTTNRIIASETNTFSSFSSTLSSSAGSLLRSNKTDTHTLPVSTSPFSYLLPWCLPSMPLDTLCRIPIVIYAYNRPDILKQTLDSIAYAALNTPYTYVSIFISVDGPDAPALTTALNWEAPSSIPISSSYSSGNHSFFSAQAFIQKILVHPVIDIAGDQRRYNWNILLLKRHWWWLLQSIFHSVHPSPYVPSSASPQSSEHAPTDTNHYNNDKNTNMKYSFPFRTPLAIVPDLSNYNGDILFLEEDSEITPDSFIIFRSLSQLKYQGSINFHSVPKRTGSISRSSSNSGRLPSVDEGPPSSSSTTKLTKLNEIGMIVLSRWGSSFGNENPYDYYVEYAHGNLGYGFNYSYWTVLEKLQEHFWSFHDGWDYSLYHLQQTNCLPPAVIGPQIPRLKHIGYEGLTTTKETYLNAGYHKTKISSLTTMDILSHYEQYVPEVQEFRQIDLHPVNKPCRGCGAGTQVNSKSSDTGPTDICKVCHGERSMDCFRPKS